MFFFFIIGTRFFTWGSDVLPQQMQCGKCRTIGQFTLKKGMQFITLFFIIPIVPISGVKQLAQCPTCGTRFHLNT